MYSDKSPRSPTSGKKRKLEQSELLFSAREDSLDTDMKIVCGGMEFPVHEFVVCRQVAAIDKMLHGDFKEARERKIVTDFTDGSTMSLFLDLVYGGLYEVGAKIKAKTEEGGASASDRDFKQAIQFLNLFLLSNYWQAMQIVDWALGEFTRLIDRTVMEPVQIAHLLDYISESMPLAREAAVSKALEKAIFRKRKTLVASETFMGAFVSMDPDMLKFVLASVAGPTAGTSGKS